MDKDFDQMHLLSIRRYKSLENLMTGSRQDSRTGFSIKLLFVSQRNVPIKGTRIVVDLPFARYRM